MILFTRHTIHDIYLFLIFVNYSFSVLIKLNYTEYYSLNTRAQFDIDFEFDLVYYYIALNHQLKNRTKEALNYYLKSRDALEPHSLAQDSKTVEKRISYHSFLECRTANHVPPDKCLDLVLSSRRFTLVDYFHPSCRLGELYFAIREIKKSQRYYTECLSRHKHQVGDSILYSSEGVLKNFILLQLELRKPQLAFEILDNYRNRATFRQNSASDTKLFDGKHTISFNNLLNSICPEQFFQPLDRNTGLARSMSRGDRRLLRLFSRRRAFCFHLVVRENLLQSNIAAAEAELEAMGEPEAFLWPHDVWWLVAMGLSRVSRWVGRSTRAC